MFLKKIDGPRVVVLPDGRSMSRADLPPSDTLRWVSKRKRAVAAAVQSGLISRLQAKLAYELSDFELDSWCRKFPLLNANEGATCKGVAKCPSSSMSRD